MEEYLKQFWEMLAGRGSGPFAFRLVLQPLTAAVIACRAGWRDAEAGRPPYGWSLLTNPVDRHDLLRQGWKDLSRVFLLAVVIDLIYEVIVFRRIYAGQTLIVATVLALLPYPLFRGVADRILHWWRSRPARRSGRLRAGAHVRRT
ncbi:MAG TPA: hypothetical protein VG675_19335 [Bryobacteraceae bacterium]|nr:hypothetical protein [Bryobacteraceae bacterium]